MRAYRLLLILMIIANALIVQAHVCSDVLSGGSQYNPGCDPVIITVNGATQNGNTVTVPMTFENRQTPFSPASSCGNPWSGGLGSVRISRPVHRKQERCGLGHSCYLLMHRHLLKLRLQLRHPDYLRQQPELRQLLGHHLQRLPYDRQLHTYMQ